ncbi:hypothetical protein [Halorhabdus sp. BNX81]|uniref:hypothetical protein n=1 Tax=Halorhabdus sp. BNX81 TaxID=2980181 RepID=UPI0023DD0F4E|nr:hypothetical protein [Halorhabdus sp. BNX81]
MPSSSGQEDEMKLDFLMDRYSQLVEEQMTTNEIIHTTFYISIVVFGALVGVLPQSSTFLTRGILSIFASGVFLAMFLWTRTYLNSRKEISNHLEDIINEFENVNFDFETVDSPDQFFSAPADYREDSWEQNWTKERLLLLYYLGLSIASLSIPILELIYLNISTLLAIIQ